MTTDENPAGSDKVQRLRRMLHAKAKGEPGLRFQHTVLKDGSGNWRISRKISERLTLTPASGFVSGFVAGTR